MELFDIYSMARDVGFLVAIGLLLARVRQLAQEPVSLRELVIDQGRQIDELRAVSNETVNHSVQLLKARGTMGVDVAEAKASLAKMIELSDTADARISALAVDLSRTIERLGRGEQELAQLIAHNDIETKKRLSWLEEAAAAKTPTAPAPKAKADDSEKSLEKVRRALKKKARK